MSNLGKVNFIKILIDCLGSDETYNPNLPSARIEGEFGRDEDIFHCETAGSWGRQV